MNYIGAVRLKDGKKHLISIQSTEEYPINTWQDAMKALLTYPDAKVGLVLVADNVFEKDLELA